MQCVQPMFSREPISIFCLAKLLKNEFLRSNVFETTVVSNEIKDSEFAKSGKQSSCCSFIELLPMI